LESEIQGRNIPENTCIGAIMAREPNTKKISALIYNYTPDAKESKEVSIALDGLRGLSTLTKQEIQIQTISRDIPGTPQTLQDLKKDHLILSQNSVAILTINPIDSK
jgi:hypothetical protein